MTDNRYLELRVYKLRPHVIDHFAARFRDQIRPMLGQHGIEVIYAGPSLHDANGWCLLRAFPSLKERQLALDAFYGSAEWLENHEGPVMEMIESHNTSVIKVAPEAIEALRDGLTSARNLGE